VTLGAANGLFYSSNDKDKQTLHRRSTPSSEQREAQQERWNLLADHLRDDLFVRSGYPINTLLQGSYKFGTQIRPVRHSEEFDIDLGVFFQWDGKAENGRYGPKTLRSIVQDCLKAYAKENPDEIVEVCEPKKRCCRVRYRNGFHLDVPVYHIDQKRDERSLATDKGWEVSDPKAIYLWFKDRFEDGVRKKVRRQIRYLKAWAALKFKDGKGRPSSIMLTVLVAEVADGLGVAALEYDDEAFSAILDALVERLKKSGTVPNPVNTYEDLNRLSTEESAKLLERLKELLEMARRALQKDAELAAADVWQEAFEHLFPMPAPDEFLAVDSSFPMLAYTPEIHVTATPNSNATRHVAGTNAIGPVPRDCSIKFEIANAHAMPRGAVVSWIVRNEGREAENSNDMGHLAGNGVSVTRSSRYNGTHYMDCVVKVAGLTVAVRRVPVIITGPAVPRRNPASKPFWTRFR
jgi:hypothetical protein